MSPRKKAAHTWGSRAGFPGGRGLRPQADSMVVRAAVPPQPSASPERGDPHLFEVETGGGANRENLP